MNPRAIYAAQYRVEDLSGAHRSTSFAVRACGTSFDVVLRRAREAADLLLRGRPDRRVVWRIIGPLEPGDPPRSRVLWQGSDRRLASGAPIVRPTHPSAAPPVEEVPEVY